MSAIGYAPEPLRGKIRHFCGNPQSANFESEVQYSNSKSIIVILDDDREEECYVTGSESDAPTQQDLESELDVEL